MNVDPARILAEATDLVAHAAKREDLSKSERLDFVTDALIDRVDALIVWPPGPIGMVAELGDGPALRALRSLLRIVSQHAYDKWKAKHAIGNEVEDDDEDAAPPVDSAPARRGRPSKVKS